MSPPDDIAAIAEAAAHMVVSRPWTPPPWAVSRHGRLIRVHIKGSGTTIAGIHRIGLHTGGVDEARVLANAHVIAAAPELFEALFAATHALRSYQYHNASTELARSIADYGDATLAKAERG